jgi:hypothetical protein
LGEGASVNAKNNDGNTALILAAQNGHLEVVNALLSEARVERDYGALLEKCKSNDCVDVIKKHQRDDFLAHLEKQTTRMNDQQKTLFDVIKKQLEKCKCPVSLEVMVNPVVIGPGGQSIEKWSYEKLPDPKTNPVNRQPITLCEENRVLKSVIDGYWQVLQGLDSALSPSASLQSGGMFATSPGSEPSAGEPAAKRRRVVGGGA